MENQKQKFVLIKAKDKKTALSQAATQLNTPVYRLEYEAVPKSIFSKIFSTTTEYKIWVHAGNDQKKQRFNNRLKSTRPNKQKKETLFDLGSADCAPLREEILNFCKELCSFIVSDVKNMSVFSDTVFDENRMVINVESKELEEMLSENPKIAESLEHLLRKKPRHLKRELPFRVMVDANGVRLKHEQELKQVAIDLSEKVATSNRPIVLNYKSAYDRRIIHLSLDNDLRVMTKSVGNGVHRKLMIAPKNLKSSPDLRL